MVSSHQSTIEKQVQVFAAGTASEYTFSAELSVEERKIVKTTAEKLGLSSRSFGIGTDRRIHIFNPTALVELEPIKYSVKNTFVDGPLDATEPQPAMIGPAHQSMPVGAFQEHLAAEDVFAPSALSKVDESPRSSQGDATTVSDTGSTASDTESESKDPMFSIKNTFVHFESDAAGNVDPRIIQSMPVGKFAENIEAEREAAAKVEKMGNEKGKPLPLSEDQETETETERSSAMVFPATPNAEMGFSNFHSSMISAGAEVREATPVAQWSQPTTAAGPTAARDSDITILPPAFWAPPAPAQILLGSTVVSQGPVQGSAQGPAQSPSQGPYVSQQAPLSMEQQVAPPPPCFMSGTTVMLHGLASQPQFNGRLGIVSAFDANCGRYNIMLELAPNAPWHMVKVKSQNLFLAQPSLPPQPPCCPQGQQPMAKSHLAKPSLLLDQMV